MKGVASKAFKGFEIGTDNLTLYHLAFVGDIIFFCLKNEESFDNLENYLVFIEMSSNVNF